MFWFDLVAILLEDVVAANEELAMQESMVLYAFLCLSTCLLLRYDFYIIA
jgi:hypothetical protein